MRATKSCQCQPCFSITADAGIRLPAGSPWRSSAQRPSLTQSAAVMATLARDSSAGWSDLSRTLACRSRRPGPFCRTRTRTRRRRRRQRQSGRAKAALQLRHRCKKLSRAGCRRGRGSTYPGGAAVSLTSRNGCGGRQVGLTPRGHHHDTRAIPSPRRRLHHIIRLASEVRRVGVGVVQ